MNIPIPVSWRNHSELEGLTDFEFEYLRCNYEIDHEFSLDDNYCDCETFVLDGTHRCKCGNRRCYLVGGSFEGRRFFSIEVY